MLALQARAQEAAPAFMPNQFLNQYEIWINGSHRCQAVQLQKDWFLTAAHCVRPACDKHCSVMVIVTEGREVSAAARIQHTAELPSVFAYPGYRRGLHTSGNVDVALFRLTPKAYEMAFTDKKTGQPLEREMFEEKLRSDSNAGAHWDAFLSPPRVRILSFASNQTARLKGLIGVPRLEAEGIAMFNSGKNDVFYVRELDHLLTLNFGVEPGMSGSGVITRGGELVGVVSSGLYMQGATKFYNTKGEVTATLDNSQNYFLFTGFTGYTLNFIRSTMKHTEQFGTMDAVRDGFAVAEPNRKFNQVIEALQGAELARP